MITTDKNPAFDANRYKLHARTVIGPDGKKAIEKRPIVKSIRAVDPAGHVCWLPLYTGPLQSSEHDPYRLSIMFHKTRAGWLPLGQCPQGGGYEVQRHLPDDLRNKQMCNAGAKGGVISDTDPCKCVLEVIKQRQAAQALAMSKVEGTVKRDEQRAHEVQAEILAETRKQNAQIAQVLAGKPQPSKDGK